MHTENDKIKDQTAESKPNKGKFILGLIVKNLFVLYLFSKTSTFSRELGKETV